MGYQIAEHKVVDLLLDPENYRLGPHSGQAETILAMIEEQGEKLVEMAKDIIAANELSPMDLVAVCASPDGSGKYIVVEGNRRVTAIKLVIEPSLATGTPIEKRIRDLSLKHAQSIIKKVPCVELPDKQTAFRWIQLKHDTGLGGAAVVPWSAMAIRRAQASQGKSHAALGVIDYVSKHGNLNETEKKNLQRISVTNLERILEDPAAMKALGLRVEDGEVLSERDKNSTLSTLSRIVRDIGNKKIKVRDIYNDQKRVDYVAKVVAEEAPTASQAAQWSIKTGASATGSSGGNKKGAKGKGILHSDRRYLIPRSCKLQVQHSRIREIYNELRTTVQLDKSPNAAAVMFRVFIELTADEYIKKYKVQISGDKLYHKLMGIATYLESQKLMTKNETKPLRMAASTKDTLLSTETWNAYVHNAQVMPDSIQLRRAWDALEPAVVQLWK